MTADRDALDAARRCLAEITRLANLDDVERVEYAAAGFHIGQTQQSLAFTALGFSAVAIADRLGRIDETLGHLVDVLVEAATESDPL